MLRDALVVFAVIFLAELPDKTMFATLMLSTRLRRPLAVWLGVSLAYCTHVLFAVLFGSALAQLPERQIRVVVGMLFLVGGAIMFRSTKPEHTDQNIDDSPHRFSHVVSLSASAILIAEFADLTQLATVGFAVRTGDPAAVGIGAATALCTVSGIAVLAGSWLQRKVPLHLVQRVASVLFIMIGLVTITSALR